MFRNSVAIKKMLDARVGTPYDELFQLPIFGLLAHSSKFKKDIHEVLHKHVFQYCQPPRQLPDFFCIADAALYSCSKTVSIGPYSSPDARDFFKGFDKDGGIITDYGCLKEDPRFAFSYEGKVLGGLICYLTERMAFEDPSLRQFADYLSRVEEGFGIALMTQWKKSNLSEEVIRRLIREGYEEERWSKWQEDF